MAGWDHGRRCTMFFRRASLSAAFTPRAVINGRPATVGRGIGVTPPNKALQGTRDEAARP